jgi:hypothetical protein
MAIGGPLVAGLGATGTLAASGLATIALAAAASVLWSEHGERAVDTRSPEPSGEVRVAE